MVEDPRRKGIQRGTFLTLDCPVGLIDRRARERQLRLDYPEFAETLDSVGPAPTADRLEQLAAERQALSDRLDEVRRRVAALKGKH